MRKALFIISLLLLISPLSCTEKSDPLDRYGETVVDKLESTRELGNQVSVARIQDSIRSFHAVNGRYPEDIEEIERFTGLTLDPGIYVYDPSTGLIALKED